MTPLAGSLGAEISGDDMAQPLDNQLYQEVHGALVENQVIFFHEQEITPAQHLNFARQSGTLHVHPLVPHIEEHLEMLVLESKDDKRNPIADCGGAHRLMHRVTVNGDRSV